MGLLRRHFDATIRSLSQVIAAELQGSDADDVARFTLARHRQLADYLQPPMLVATLFFDWSGYLRAGKPFHRQSFEQRREQVASWRRSRLGPKREYIHFHHVLALLRAHSGREK